MGILVNRNTRVIVQGITGREGTFHTEQMQQYGTKVRAGVVPGKGGQEHLGVPLFDTVAEAKRETGADATFIIVPAAFAADAIIEAALNHIPLIVCVTEGIPVYDVMRAYKFVNDNGSRLIGPNCPGVLTAGECKIGFIPNSVASVGRVGVIGRSGTLTYETIQSLTTAGLGLSTAVGIGGDPVLGTTYTDVLPEFERDAQTEALVLIGEIGGGDEEEAAAFIAKSFSKPVVAFISGRNAPEGKRMGHAGAIISGNVGTAQSKVDALTKAGATVVDTISEIPETLKKLIPTAAHA